MSIIPEERPPENFTMCGAESVTVLSGPVRDMALCPFRNGELHRLSHAVPAVAAHAGTSLEEEAFPAEETHVMHESVALRTALPASPEQGGATG